MRLGIILASCLAVSIMLLSLVSASSVGLIENATWQGNLTSSAYSNAIALGDINGDGYLDMVEIGCSSGVGICDQKDASRIYINNGTAFVQNYTWQQNLSSIGYGSLVLGDIDNDGDLDLILSGRWPNYITRVYINNGTTFTENASWQGPAIIDNAGSSSILLGDIDNDGDLDSLFTGTMGLSYQAVFINNGTSFVNNSIWSQDIIETSIASSFLADFENDGDLDLNVMGLESSRAYVNNGTSLVYNSVWNVFTGDEDSIVAGDIDNNGSIDVIQMGSGGICTNGANILINNGSQFVNDYWHMAWNQDMSCYPFGSLALGDYDNNGYLDLSSFGSLAGSRRQIFSNNGTAFEEDSSAEANVTGEMYSSAVWADVDNDMDLDLIVIRSQKVYINNITQPNSQPSPPVNFNSSYNNRRINLEWGNGSDNETSSTGLYYNLKVGTSSNNNSIISGVYGGYADQTGGGTTGGYFGNMMQRKSFSLKVDRLQSSTTYYWAVQTIDTGLNTSDWSSVQSFTTQADMEQPDITLNAPDDNYNFSVNSATFNLTAYDNLNLSNVSLWGNWSGWHLNDTNSSGLNNSDYLFTIDFAGYGDGIYQWHASAEDNATNKANSSTRTFTIDTTAPLISSEAGSPAVYNTTNAVLNATVTDSLVGVSGVWVQVNISGARANYSIASSTQNYSFALLAGNYSKGMNVTWRYYSNDTLGNEREGSLQSFIVLNSAPILSGIPDSSTNEDTVPSDRWINLSLYASDLDNDSLSYYVESESNSSLIACMITESIYLNCSMPAANSSGNSTVTVNASDGVNWSSCSLNITVIAINDAPWANSINMTSDDNSNRTTANLAAAYAFNDLESATETLNETRWYRNGTEVQGLRNLSYVDAGNTTKHDNWSFSVRVYDGDNWSIWQNSSNMTILNSIPSFTAIGNLSWLINTNYTLNLSSYFSDLDYDPLSYSNTTAESMNISIESGIATLYPAVDWNGTSNITFTADDSEASNQSNNITIGIFRPEVNATEFGGATTNFTNLTSFINISITIERAGSGRIDFGSVTLNSSAFDFDSHMNISQNRIEVNSTALPSFNVNAVLYLHGLSYSNPRILRDGSACSSQICSIIAYNATNGTLIFNVTGFSVYSSDETPTSPPSGGGSGGGGGGVSYLTFSVGELKEQDVNKALGKGDKINFDLNSEGHNLTINSITKENATIEINSTIARFVLSIGESKMLNLSSSEFYDLFVRLNSITNLKANITIRKIYEIISPKEEKREENVTEAIGNETEPQHEPEIEEKQSSRLPYLILGGIAVVAVLGIAFSVYRKFKNPA